MKPMAEAGVKTWCSRRVVARANSSSEFSEFSEFSEYSEFSVFSESLYNIAMVETMASLAGRPVRMQTFIFQSKPRGDMTGSIHWPIRAR